MPKRIIEPRITLNLYRTICLNCWTRSSDRNWQQTHLHDDWYPWWKRDAYHAKNHRSKHSCDWLKPRPRIRI